MSTTEEKSNWLTNFITGFGVPANWAKVIAGAIIGALAAAGVLTLDSCTASIDLLPDGTQHWQSELEIPVEVITERMGGK